MTACWQESLGNYGLVPDSLQPSQGGIIEISGSGHDYLASQANSWHWLCWSRCQQDPGTVILGARVSAPSKCIDYTILGFSVSERSLIDENKGLYDFYCPRSVLPFPRASGKVES